jgi:hypothetical protein
MDAWRLGGNRNYGLADKRNVQAATGSRQSIVKDLSPIDLRKFLTGKDRKCASVYQCHDEGIEGCKQCKRFWNISAAYKLIFYATS